jgi:hypothetical protein
MHSKPVRNTRRTVIRLSVNWHEEGSGWEMSSRRRFTTPAQFL